MKSSSAEEERQTSESVNASPSRYGVRLLSEVDRSWLAGVIDSEGSILITRVTAASYHSFGREFAYVPVVSLSNSNQDLVLKVKEVIGKGSVNFTEEKRRNWKDKWSYRASSGVLRGLLPQLIPKLLIKKEVAKKVLEYVTFIEINPIDGAQEIPPGYLQTLDSLYFQIKELNQKGNDSESLQLLNTQLDSLARGGRGRRVDACRQMNEEERAWLAAVVDSEGSLFISKVVHDAYRRGYFYRPQFLISNSNRTFLVRAREVIGEGTVHMAKRGTNGWKTRWEYLGVAGVLRVVLPQILDRLIAKRRQAETMLDFFTYIDENPILGKSAVSAQYYAGLDRLYNEIKKSNQKGKLLPPSDM